jgi:hydrogenase nickel incorporation protein HypA/HybF
MHEMSIALSIIDIVNDKLVENERSRLKKIVVDIGELVAVVPDSLQFCYETIVNNTEYHNATLNINTIPLKIKCSNCNIESGIEKFAFLCPKCESTRIQVISGEELNIRYLEVK